VHSDVLVPVALGVEVRFRVVQVHSAEVGQSDLLVEVRDLCRCKKITRIEGRDYLLIYEGQYIECLNQTGNAYSQPSLVRRS
jgi:hypothetical protein